MNYYWTRCLPLLGLLFASAVTADTQLLIQQEGVGAPQPIWIQAGKVRVQPAEQSGYVLFDANRQLLTQVDDANRSYATLDQKMLKTFAQNFSSIKQALSKQLDQLPAEQRVQLQALMQQSSLSQLPDTEKTPPLSFKKTNVQRQIKGKNCTVTEGWHGADKMVEFCLLDLNAAHVTPQDYQTLKAFLAFAQSATSEMMAGQDWAMDLAWMEQPSSFPIQMLQFNKQHVVKRSVTVELINKSLDAALFQVPNHYQYHALDFSAEK